MAKHGFAKILHGLRNHLHELTGSQLKVWLCHRLHEGKNATAFPSIHTIAKETGLDPSTVGTAHTWLRANGWLKTLSYRSAESGRFAVPVARCTYPWLKQETPPSMGNPVSVESTVHGFSVDGSTVDGFDPIEVDTPKEAASAVPLPQPTQDPEVFRPTGGNQPINQPIKKKPSASPQAPPFSDELQNPQGLGLEPNKEQEQNQTGEEEEWMEDVKLVFPHAGALGSMHRRMWSEVMDKIKVFLPPELIRDGRKIPIPLPITFAGDMVAWNLSHITDGPMRIRGLRGLWNAVIKADSENGIMVQTLYHDEASCKKCVAKKKQQAKAASGNGHAPLWMSKKLDDGTMLRSLGRKPVTSMERDELIEALQQPKIHREYVLRFLVQDNCPECRGQDMGCECCVLTSEVLPDPPIARTAAESGFEADEL